MTNDTTTLNGALAELGELMADNLVSQGVTGASASDGLTTLANKILDIQTGSSCYHIEFSEDSYTAVGGSVTLECTLQQNYSPLANATVTFSDGTSFYSSITNSQGIATFNLTGLSATNTWTCSYNNVSDTCTITVSSYLFYDACDADNTNLYDTTTNYSNSTLTFDSTNSCYTMQRTSGSGMSSLWIKDLTVTDKVKITVDMKLATTSAVIMQGGPIIMNSAKNKGFLTMIEGYSGGDGEYSLGTTNSPNSHGTKVIADLTLGLNARNYWFTYELIIDGSSVELNIYNGSTLIKTGTITSSQLDSNGNIVGLLMSYGSGAKISVKNIKVEPILFYDECSSAEGLSNYGAIRPISSSTTTSYLEYNSTENAYYVHANGDWGIIPITALNGLDNYKITAEFKTKGSGVTYQGGLGFIAESGTNNLLFRVYGTTSNININSSSKVSIGSITNASSRWHKFEVIKQGRNYTVTLTDMTSGNVVGTKSYTYSSDTYYVGFMTVAGTNYGSYVRNVKAEPI